MFIRKLAVPISAAAFLLAGWVSPLSSAPYFEGKTITVIVGFGSGGIDTAARIFTRHMAQYIPGNPGIVVRNMPGGASLKAQNFVFERAKRDGLTLSYNPWQAMAQLIGAPGLRFKYEDFTYIGAVVSNSSVAVARTDVIPGGLKRPEDIVKAKNLKYTGRNPTHNIDIDTTPALKLLGVKFRYVPGYRGAAKIRLSLETGETNITGTGLGMLRNTLDQAMVKKGTMIPLWYYRRKNDKGNYVDSPLHKGIPAFDQVYKRVHGKNPSGPLWEAYSLFRNIRGTMSQAMFGPPKMNKEATAILRKAFKMVATQDKKSRAEQVKINGWVYPYVSVDAARKIMLEVKNADPKVVAFWKKQLTRKKKKK